MATPPQVTAVEPRQAVEGGRISIHGRFGDDAAHAVVLIGDRPARIAYASSSRLDVVVAAGYPASGTYRVRLQPDSDGHVTVDIASPFASGLHQVDSPVFDRHGNLYLTYSGTRGEHAAVSIFKVGSDGVQQPFAAGIVNPTSMAVDADGALYVSSRFEGVVYRLDEDGTANAFATDLGVACGLAFGKDGTLYVGDRSGTIFKVDRTGRARTFVSLPASVAAFHLAMAPDGTLLVTAPTFSTYDAVYRVDHEGHASVLTQAFGRPQGLGFDRHGRLYVAEALAGASGIYRVDDGVPKLAVAGPSFVGLAFDRNNRMVVCSSESAYRLDPSQA